MHFDGLMQERRNSSALAMEYFFLALTHRNSSALAMEYFFLALTHRFENVV